MSGELPDGWILTSVEELGSPNQQPILTGPFGASLGKEDFRAAGVPVFTIGCLTDRGIKRDKLLFIGEEKAAELSTYRLKAGDFLFSRMATVGRAGFVPPDLQGAIFNYHIMRLRLDAGTILPKYFFFYVRGARTVFSYLDDVNRGVTRDGINTSLLSRMPVQLPPRAEQHRIIEKIEALFARSTRARDELAHIPRLIERYRRAVLEAAFRGDLTADWRAHNGPTAPKITSRSPIDGRVGEMANLPAGWLWRSIGDVCDVTGGLTKNQARSTLPTRMPYLRVANVYANELRLDQIEEIGVTPGEAARVRLNAGDLLIVEGNGSLDQIGRVALWQGEIGDCGHQNHLIKARPGARILPKFALYWLLSPMGRAAIEAVASSSSGLHTLSISKVNGLPIPFCSLDEMSAIVERIESRLGVLADAAAQYDRAQGMLVHLDQSILDKAFAGELVPQDPTDEPATALLARIKAERAGEPSAGRGRRRRTVAP